MHSDLPKVLHRIHGRPLVTHLLDTLTPLSFDRIVVVIGHKGEMVEAALADYPVQFAWQREQLGTGHAVQMTRSIMTDFDGTTLVLAGDVPFLSAHSINRLFEFHERTGSVATCLSAIFDDPKGYGRIVRVHGTDRLQAIVEEKDATEEQLAIHEINSGTFCFNNRRLFEIIDQLRDDNAQREYYLTDAIKILHDKRLPVSVLTVENPDEVRGINDTNQLEELATKFPDRQ